MAKTQFLQFYIVLPDPEQVAELQEEFPNGVIRAPFDAPDGGAAIEFGAPWRGYTDVDQVAPFSWSPWATTQIADGPFPIDVATFQRRTGGFWIFGGSTVRYYWQGFFVYQPPATVTTPPEGGGAPVTANLTPILFADGFEFGTAGGGSGASGNGANFISREASRTLEGSGLAIRQNTGSIGNTYGWTSRTHVWMRFYIRIRTNPTASTEVAALSSSVSATDPVRVHVLPSGQLALVWDATSPTTICSSNPLTIGEFFKVDVVAEQTGAAFPSPYGDVQMWVDGVEVTDDPIVANVNGMPGWAGGSLLDGAHIGTGSAGANGGEFDIDDAIFRGAPDATGGGVGIDWEQGDHVVGLVPNGFGASHAAGWAGDFRSLQFTPAGGTITETFTSSTASAKLAATTNIEQVLAAFPGSHGVAAFTVCKYGRRTTNNGSLGYILDGSETTAAITEAGTDQWNHVVFTGPGATPTPLSPSTLELVYIKGAGVDAAVVRTLGAHLLLVGTFGTCDHPPSDEEPEALELRGLHNHPYPNTPWTIQGPAPLSPVAIYAGTFVGNGTGRDLPAFPSPVHFVFFRAVSGSNELGGTWFSGMLTGHFDRALGTNGGPMVQLIQNPAFDPDSGEEEQQTEFLVRIFGNNANVNANGVTYQYLAISDPGERFLTGGAFSRNSSKTSDSIPLGNPDFLPEAAWLRKEQVGAGAGSGLFYKGPGYAAATWQAFDAAEAANALTFGTGALATQAPPHHASGQGQTGFMCFRRDDGSDDPGVHRVVQLYTYIGNGAGGTRAIDYGVGLGATASGRRPLFAWVFPHNGAGLFRDPSHTGTTSSTFAGVNNAATGITAGGIDQLTVGTVLNASGIVYDVFVIPGETTAGNGGWSINPVGGVIIPVEADSPFDGDHDADHPDPDGELEEDDDVDPGDLTTDIADTCEPASRRLVNLALQEIGITQQVANLSTEQSREAQSARLIYKTTIDAVLREFAWPFATEYDNVDRVAGEASDPVNGDWQYSYRAPSDCVYVRRIVDPNGQKRGAYPAIPFRMGADSDGDLIYTDQPNNEEEDTSTTPDTPAVGPEIEYTRRIECPASRGDAIFRQACIYRLGAALAKALGRDAKDADRCMRNYLIEIAKAKTVHANEQEHQDDVGADPDWIAGR